MTYVKKVIFWCCCLGVLSQVSAISEYATQAAQLPVAFAVVREDSTQDEQLIKRYFPEERVSMLMVASGGDTAAHLLATAPLSHLTVVDPNAAQLALTRLKIQLLTLPTSKRLEILGYQPMAHETRKCIIQGLMYQLDIPTNILGNLDEVAQYGLDRIGRYEQVFAELRRHLALHEAEIAHLFTLNSIEEQAGCLASGTLLGDALDTAFNTVMSQDNLVVLFGEKATANRVQDFSRHFAKQLRLYASHYPLVSSPWCAHLLLGKFVDASTVFPWISAKTFDARIPVRYEHGFMNDVLKRSTPEAYHVVHLSNILDWLSPEEAQETLQLAYRALKPGGIVIIRQLNSSIDIPDIGAQFSWNHELSNELTKADRSFFYRHVLVGMKQRVPEAPQVTACANDVLRATPIIQNRFFSDLPHMPLELFQGVQSQFFFAVDYFSRPMAALVARLPLHHQRIDIIHNIVEEHGDFNAAQYHSNTFKQFLSTIGVDPQSVDQLVPSPAVHMFNTTLMGACALGDPVTAIACLGIIEYAYAELSARIAQTVVQRGWVAHDRLIHYGLHAYLDQQHAQDFFKIIEAGMDSPEHKQKVMAGLTLGAYIFNRLYEDLYTDAQHILCLETTR